MVNGQWSIKHSLLTLLLCLMLAACSDNDGTPDVVVPKTAIVYFSAQNSLKGYVMRDVNEISTGAASLKDGEKVVVYLDNNDGTALYVFDNKHTAVTPVMTYEHNMDSSDPATLAAVLEWVRTHYPAESYGLTMWSHADGWLAPLNTDYAKSIGVDDGDKFDLDKGTSMAIEDLADVMRHSGMKFRYVFFDACLMQCIETDYALRDVTDYVIASPISTTADGAYYTHQLTNGLFADDPADIARTYFDDVEKRVSSSYSLGMVISAVKTAGLDSLASLTHQLLEKNNIQWSMVHSQFSMNEVQAYSQYTPRLFYRPDYFDAAGAMRQILPAEDAERWCKQLDECIVYKAGTPRFYAYGETGDGFFDLQQDFCGVSMFVPQQKYTDNAGLCPYGDLNEEYRLTEWAKAIEN